MGHWSRLDGRTLNPSIVAVSCRYSTPSRAGRIQMDYNRDDTRVMDPKELLTLELKAHQRASGVQLLTSCPGIGAAKGREG